MAGGLFPVQGTADLSRVESPVSAKAYLICAFAAFGGIFFGYEAVKIWVPQIKLALLY